MADQGEEKLLIRLHVYDTDLSVRIPREDEEYYRKSGKLIDDIVNSYNKIFKGRKSDKEILYMALIDIALRYEKEVGRNDTEPYDDLLKKLIIPSGQTIGRDARCAPAVGRQAAVHEHYPGLRQVITELAPGGIPTVQNQQDCVFRWKRKPSRL